MTPSQRNTYHRQYIRWHTGQERIAKRLVLSRFRVMADGLVRSIESSTPMAALGALDILISENAHLAMVEAIYLQVGVVAAQREYSRLLPAKSTGVAMQTKDRDVPGNPNLPSKPNPSGLLQVGFQSQQWREKMIQMARSSETALRITKMTARTKQVVRDVLTRGAEQNWSLPKLAKNLRSVVVDKVRAVLIARTETTRASSAGHEAGAMSTLLKLDKVWITTYDGRTRESHIEAGKLKPVPRDGFFLVSGLPMKYPGDPAGGIAECARCRCTVSYIPSRDYLNLN